MAKKRGRTALEDAALSVILDAWRVLGDIRLEEGSAAKAEGRRPRATDPRLSSAQSSLRLMANKLLGFTKDSPINETLYLLRS